MELKLERTDFQIFQDIESYLIFGMYPEVLSLDNALENTEYLVNLRNSYLFKDILALEHIRNSQKLQDIVRLLAFQIGNEVSLNEIAVKTGLSKNTVERYLDLLEKAFVIKKISAFSRNLRNEISKSAKYYFWDTGIRNAVINDFRPIELRNDLGALWENFVVMELMKDTSINGNMQASISGAPMIKKNSTSSSMKMAGSPAMKSNGAMIRQRFRSSGSKRTRDLPR